MRSSVAMPIIIFTTVTIAVVLIRQYVVEPAKKRKEAELELKINAEQIEATRDSVVVIEPIKPRHTIPPNTLFKVSDWVCINHFRASGVVTEIQLGQIPEGHPIVLVYEIETYDDDTRGSYYETELTKGKCN